MRAHLVTRPASPLRANEDAVALAPQLAVLADGAGIPARYRAGCAHPVAWYSHHLVAAVTEAAADPRQGLREAVALAIARVRRLHEGTCDLAAGSPSATLVVARINEASIEHLILCDSALLVEDADGRVRRLSDGRLDRLRERLAARGQADDLEALRNRPGGFWVARHEEEAAERALVGAIPRTGVRRLALVSDGITRAVDMLSLTDDAGLLSAAASPRGAGALIARIRAAEDRRDREGRLPARKVHDDATVIGIDLPAPQGAAGR